MTEQLENEVFSQDGTIADSDVEEDELVQDWSQIAKIAKSNGALTIPKRGEKDYEPDGTDVQELLLYKARKELFDTLANSVRGSTVKAQVKALYVADRHGAVVPHARGNFLQTMGKVDFSDGQVWLSFYEFVYLSERGTVTPYWGGQSVAGENNDSLLPLSIEDLYILFKTQHELDNFAVYAHLRRLGFIVNPVSPSDTSFYPNCPSAPRTGVTSIYRAITSMFFLRKNSLFNNIFYKQWHYCFCKYTRTPQIYEKLKLLVPSISVPKTIEDLKGFYGSQQDYAEGQLTLTFNVWKPQTNFKKKHPPLPDYQVVVYNKNQRGAHFPTFDELQNIFRHLDYKFQFLSEVADDEFSWDDHSYIVGKPRSDVIASERKSKDKKDPKTPAKNPSAKKSKKRQLPPHIQQLQRLRNGYSSFLLAVIDNGIISFVRISQADFASENVWYVPPKDGLRKKPFNDRKKRAN
ncbi:tRNA splicing endonuclease subunit SEN54 KNAG_0A03590 [Huiozyma naganishii CBS 8797]|uniref:tRNA-splicing endonuclease subunit Sen54 N-terminal domain-containing protein n=1 Tax=Huiozyma naganishii (strain ATCC MYA-139 / BCRC 22969 / CBS 8797 / KCTC 17520 / NBRC 10181 / NCYC 3082 / Yp74L-3) TaxID=1071383 RepID=J7QZV5_HUIN7|nr:hypothetical protein KNAG_0A03590 [Kazachstania naganishii CBS 8797]CCK68040.1 hypothetical protein KNAG_0A03590 [Kazachstania naganishii CBS 8797]